MYTYIHIYVDMYMTSSCKCQYNTLTIWPPWKFASTKNIHQKTKGVNSLVVEDHPSWYTQNMEVPNMEFRPSLERDFFKHPRMEPKNGGVGSWVSTSFQGARFDFQVNHLKTFEGCSSVVNNHDDPRSRIGLFYDPLPFMADIYGVNKMVVILVAY